MACVCVVIKLAFRSLIISVHLPVGGEGHLFIFFVQTDLSLLVERAANEYVLINYVRLWFVRFINMPGNKFNIIAFRGGGGGGVLITIPACQTKKTLRSESEPSCCFFPAIYRIGLV